MQSLVLGAAHVMSNMSLLSSSGVKIKSLHLSIRALDKRRQRKTLTLTQTVSKLKGTATICYAKTSGQTPSLLVEHNLL